MGIDAFKSIKQLHTAHCLVRLKNMGQDSHISIFSRLVLDIINI